MAIKKAVTTKNVKKSSVKKEALVIMSPKVQEKVVAKPVVKKKVTAVKASKKTPEKLIPNKPLVREEWVAEAAYYLAEARNFVTGYEQEDWSIAEQKYEKEALI